MDLFNFLPLKFPAWSELQLNTFMSAWALAYRALLATVPETGAI
jgi:hypothetical protein